MRGKAAAGAGQGGMVSALGRAESDKCRHVGFRQNQGDRIKRPATAGPRIVADGRAPTGSAHWSWSPRRWTRRPCATRRAWWITDQKSPTRNHPCRAWRLV